ncbi:sensor domain-containing protein [Streptomyces sp. NPDC058372]|uniref:sensor domain-containing protein n=1 Tax=Streptomyces sp. NPDC058372 TaxID=3346464 RepID=UPI003653DBD5
MATVDAPPTCPLPHVSEESAFSERPAVVRRGPLAAATWREIGYVFSSFPVAIAGFVFAVTLFSAGAGLAITVLGLPVLAVLLAGARLLGAGERGRAGALLGMRTVAPAPVGKGGIKERLADVAGWKAVLFQVVMFPWRIASFVVTLTFLATGWVVALLPLYAWVFPTFVGWPGYRLFDFTTDAGVHHAYYLESPFQIGAASLLGIGLVLLTPVLVRAMNRVERSAVRGLLAG